MKQRPHSGAESSGELGPTAPARGSGQSLGVTFDWALHWVHPVRGVLKLGDGPVRIGRQPDLESVLNDDQVSRQHALITREGAACWLHDQRSTNGVHVQGTPIAERVALHDGCVVRIGSHVGVIVHAPGADEPFRAVATFRDTTFFGSAKLAAVLTQASRLAPRPEPIFIRAESGCGKEMLAEFVHRESRRGGRYVSLNASTVRGDLASSTLFGHVRGAFTDARADSRGTLLEADGGTLFLDEIAELPLDTQPLLLRFLENGQITPLGSSKTLCADVRVVSATHDDLLASARDRRFREDLYYRLRAHELNLPPLRERREDILPMFEQWTRRSGPGFSAGFVETLLVHAWPGNVRELISVAARLSALYSELPQWTSELLQPHLSSSTVPSSKGEPDWKQLYERHAGSTKHIAQASGWSEATVKRRVVELGLRESKKRR